MSKDLSELDKLIKESEAAIQRLDDVQKAQHNAPLLERIRRHLHKNSPHLLNVLMAGTVLAVALGRLDQKHKHEAEKEQLAAEQRRLEKELSAAEGRAAAMRSSTEQLVAALEEAAEGRGRKDLPALVRQQLADWRARASGAAPGAATPQAAASEGGGDGSSSGGGATIMI
ncbi:hypothetical protein ABPG75_008855 [Micractinium tetrahymenae]